MLTTVITGTSTGIGYATALHLARAGHRVFATMRDLDKSNALHDESEAEGLSLEFVELDVTKADSVKEAFKTIYDITDVVDILVNNAGLGGIGALEDLSMEQVEILYETNVFGALRCIKAVLPQMRTRRSGCIINISSQSGYLTYPGMTHYSGSKHALEAATESLACEVGMFGIRVSNIQPGTIDTQIQSKGSRPPRDTVYTRMTKRLFVSASYGVINALPPDVVAEAVLEAITTDQYKLRYRVGVDAEVFFKGLGKLTDEEWIAFHSIEDEDEYWNRWLEIFGFDPRL